jgi:hypothetical protein
MAVYETSKSARYGASVGQGWSRQHVVDCAIVALGTGMIDNADDDVGLLWLPKGAVITGCTLSVTDMDGSTGLVLDVGISGTEELLIANATTGQAGGINATMAQAAHLYKCAARTQVRLYISTAASSGVAGTAKFHITYFVDEDFDTTALVPFVG